MPWYKVPFTSNQVAEGEHIALQKKFEKTFITLGAPKEMALFRSTSPISEDEFEIIYFTPISSRYARELILLYSGILCERPDKDDVALLVGHQEDWEFM